MKTTTTQQEILIFTNTRFSSREWVKKDENDKSNLSPKEQLKDACWNGLITELLPEICEKTYDPNVTLWEINEANSFLALQFGELNGKLDNEFSINPYASLESQHFN
jgi:hypothetical protein